VSHPHDSGAYTPDAAWELHLAVRDGEVRP